MAVIDRTVALATRAALTAVAWALEGIDAVAKAFACEPVELWANEAWADVAAKLDHVANAPP